MNHAHRLCAVAVTAALLATGCRGGIESDPEPQPISAGVDTEPTPSPDAAPPPPEPPTPEADPSGPEADPTEVEAATTPPEPATEDKADPSGPDLRELDVLLDQLDAQLGSVAASLVETDDAIANQTQENLP